MKNKIILKNLLKKNIINEVDINLYKILQKNENKIIKIIILLLIYTYKIGNISLNTKKIYKQTLILKNIWKKFFSIKNYYKIIKNSIVISDKVKSHTPIIFYKKKFYFHKMLHLKKNIDKNIFTKINANQNINYIKKLLKKNKINKLNKFQKISLILSVLNKKMFILGGAGTGKTTVISYIIFFILKIFRKIKKIKIAAATGKAATNILFSIKKHLSKLKIKKSDKKKIPKRSYTIHDLLKISPGKTYPKFCKKKKLNIDLLIIDEISMISTILFKNLIDATKKTTKIIFLGDFNQISSMSRINILRHICKKENNSFSKKISKILEYITNYKILKKKKSKDNICILKKNYRVKKTSGIYKISQMILKSQTKILTAEITKKRFKDIIFKEIHKQYEYICMIKMIVKKYKRYWSLIKKNSNPLNILKEFNKIRILCAIKKGPFGTKQINKNIKKIIIDKKIIKKKEKWYIGKPIMITENQKDLNIFNGYIGILLYDKKKKKRIFFKTYENSLLKIPKYAIKKYDVSWASTIHKSQGLEFKETIIILPEKQKKIFNKELIYTGITRTIKKTTIFVKNKILIKSIK
ncbi:exodeoxyribonuclease V subunit alpha [Buchnera aphidicola (Chaitoregma tattakana)]|uniref:exodeoxyribonuclease V subunit alpha n=1 Tax=Buchnera aphidicola TaxID=9 RepID=UPI0031B874DF